MSKVIVFNGSPRKNGNTDLLVQEFVKSAKTHHEVEVINVTEYKINPCLGCNACFNNENKCQQNDDMNLIYEKMKQADIAVFASPVYFYGISSQLKALVDRFHNPVRDTFKIKKLALILVGAASKTQLFDSIITQYKLILDFFTLQDGGMILVRGAKNKGDVKDMIQFQEVQKLGEEI